MRLIKTLSLSLLLCNVVAFGWEVNTHRAIDRCAIGNTKGQACGRSNVAENLHWFAERNIPKENGLFESYFDQNLENYPGTYFSYIANGETKGISNWNQSFNSYEYVSLIEAGTILEDALYPSALFGGDGRFNNHFYDPQNGGKGLTIGYGTRVDAITWAETATNNQYNYEKALEYYKKGFISNTPDERKKYRAKMLVSLGYLLHLLNDMNVPAHTRDDSHPSGDPLEVWMRGGKNGKDSGGFKVVKSALDPQSNVSIRNALSTISAFKYDSTVNFRKYYEEQANFTGNNFYSEDTISVNGGTFGGYSGYSPNGSEVTTYTGDSTSYITSNSPNLDSQHNKLAMMQKSRIPFKKYWYSMEFDGDKSVLIDNGINLIPKAVANAEGFINYFFRGRLKATLTDGELTITNVSNPNLVAEASVVNFNTDGKFNVYYETSNNEIKFLKECPLNGILAVDESVVCNISTEFEDKKSEMGEEQKLTVIYEGGSIGNEKGLSVAIVKKLADADILFSFDKSGSMGSSIEDAKSSAISILDDIVGVDNNSTYIEIEAFSSSASVLLTYDNNVTKAKNSISTLYSGGSTALYDAIQLAGNSAVTHKQDSNISKSIVILYTDGRENGSYTSKQSAINAISNAYASNIDEVFLIFVGSDSYGESQLKSIADAAGRKFMSVSNASGLKNAIEQILQGQ